MLWLNQECECQKLDLEPGAQDWVGPPLLQPLSLTVAWLVSGGSLVLMLGSCEGVWLLLDLSFDVASFSPRLQTHLHRCASPSPTSSLPIF